MARLGPRCRSHRCRLHRRACGEGACRSSRQVAECPAAVGLRGSQTGGCAHLMRKAIRCHQRSQTGGCAHLMREAIICHQRQSEVIRDPKRVAVHTTDAPKRDGGRDGGIRREHGDLAGGDLAGGALAGGARGRAAGASAVPSAQRTGVEAAAAPLAARHSAPLPTAAAAAHITGPRVVCFQIWIMRFQIRIVLSLLLRPGVRFTRGTARGTPALRRPRMRVEG